MPITQNAEDPENVTLMEKVTLNEKEQKRLLVFNEVLAGRMTGQEAAEMLGVTIRHTRRLLAGYRQEGAAALAHGNRGRRPVNRLDEAVAEEIVRLAQETYADYNDSHFTEELGERHGIRLSRPTVRRVRQEQGLGSPRKRRSPRHRQRRARYPQAGMLLQVDGSRHDWLEGRGPWLTLHAAIDDGTNEVPWALFREEEDATGYALLLHHISRTHGLPLALYADRHTIFQSPKQATVAEQLQRLEPRSHLGRLLDRLQIRLIPAYSPQAKGRVERLFETLQDRLVKELRRAGASTLSEANAALQAYLPRFNRRFMLPPAQPGSAYRPRLTLAEADARICFTYGRVVNKDHTISLFGHTLSLPPQPVRRNLAGCLVQLRHQMDGRLAVLYQDQLLGRLQPAQLGPPRLEQFQPAAQHLAPPRSSWHLLPPPQETRREEPTLPAPLPTPSHAEESTMLLSAVEEVRPPKEHPWRREGRVTFERRRQQQQQK